MLHCIQICADLCHITHIRVWFVPYCVYVYASIYNNNNNIYIIYMSYYIYTCMICAILCIRICHIVYTYMPVQWLEPPPPSLFILYTHSWVDVICVHICTWKKERERERETCHKTCTYFKQDTNVSQQIPVIDIYVTRSTPMWHKINTNQNTNILNSQHWDFTWKHARNTDISHTHTHTRS